MLRVEKYINTFLFVCLSGMIRKHFQWKNLSQGKLHVFIEYSIVKILVDAVEIKGFTNKLPFR